ncbi:MAG: hypothetical protein ACE5DN_00070 [Flavobacteriales bacterium]
MDFTEDLAKSIIYILPSLVVFATAYYILKQFFDNERKKRGLNIRLENQKVSLPMRLQAYERMVLFMERISPDGLMMRVHRKDMSARELQAVMLQNIRSEFEHNLTQQIYISDNAWGLVKNAKEETIRIINIAASKVADDASGTDLSNVVFKIMSEMEKTPTLVATEFLRKEARKFF